MLYYKEIYKLANKLKKELTENEQGRISQAKGKAGSFSAVNLNIKRQLWREILFLSITAFLRCRAVRGAVYADSSL